MYPNEHENECGGADRPSNPVIFRTLPWGHIWIVAMHTLGSPSIAFIDLFNLGMFRVQAGYW